MAKHIASEGADFVVEHLDRGTGGVRTTAIKVDGTTGAVTIGTQVIGDDVDVTGDFSAGGDTALAGDLDVTGDAAVTGTLSVTGAVDLAADVTLATGVDLVCATSGAGTNIGTAATQKIALYGATPVVQPSATGQTAGFTAGSGTAAKDDSTFTGGSGTKAYTIGDIVKHLKALGLLASS